MALGATNTAVLICSSLTVVLAVWAAQTARRTLLLGSLAITMLLGLTFLGIKGIEYKDKFVEHHVPGASFSFDKEEIPGHPGQYANPAHAQIFFSLYFVMTGLHALHMIIGLGIFLWLFLAAWKGRFTPEYNTPIEIGGLYWHFVDIVWIYLVSVALPDRPAPMRLRMSAHSTSSPLPDLLRGILRAARRHRPDRIRRDFGLGPVQRPSGAWHRHRQSDSGRSLLHARLARQRKAHQAGANGSIVLPASVAGADHDRLRDEAVELEPPRSAAFRRSLACPRLPFGDRDTPAHFRRISTARFPTNLRYTRADQS